MTQRNSTPAARKKPFLAHLYRRNDTTTSFSMADGPAWRSRAVTPTRLSPILGIFFAALAATPLTTHAGDILRGGANAGARGSASGVNASSAQATSQARANAQDALARTTQAVQAVQAMQNVARSSGSDNAGRNPVNGLQLPNVPNGLTPGGLVVAPGGVWTGARQPQQSKSGSQTVVDIQQTASQAILTWQSFNIGRNTLLNFDQSFGGSQASQWIVFNKVVDPSGVPSQILGSIQSVGQVFVINRNGIIFGGSSQVNTHALFASSLPINDNLISSGLLNNPNEQFLFSGLAIPATTGTNATPAFTPDPLPAGQVYGDVTVEAGAILTAPTTASHVGGRVVLVGANVTNNGTIVTPDGQTILAAGLQVGFGAHPSVDPSLRGLDAYVGMITDPSGKIKQTAGIATNNGLIETPRASTIITGASVNQNGIIDSSTSVTLNGRVDLQANYNSISNKSYDPTNASDGAEFLPAASGTVTFGTGSVTRILPEISDTDTVAGTQLALPSLMNIQGKAIHLGVNSTLLAPGAALPTGTGAVAPVSSQPLSGNSSFNLQAGISMSAGTWSTFNGGDQFLLNGGQIYADKGALVSVAGTTNVAVPVGQNILSVQFRGGELSDSPVQRNGVLRATSLQIDLRQTGVFDGVAWIGTPLANAWGFVNLIQRTVAQLTTAGGSVSLKAGDSVVLQKGSTVDVSGGYINYQGGMVQTTRVISSNGQLLDISQATPDQTYAGIYTGTWSVSHSAWGVTNQYTSPLALTGAHFEQTYVNGAAGGQIAISAASVALDGTLRGNTITGPRQQSNAPAGSALAINIQSQNSTGGTTSPTPASIYFLSNNNVASADPFALDSTGAPLPLRADRRSQIFLDPNLVSADGFATLNISNGDGSITVPSGVVLKTPAGGSITLAGANIDVEGQVITPAGNQSFTTYNVSPSGGVLADRAPANPGKGVFTLGSNATLSAAGLVVDDRASSATALQNPLGATSVALTSTVFGVATSTSSVTTTNGGSISIQGFSANLAPGSVIDVSGGVAFSSTGKRTYGNGGSITIQAGRDPGITYLIGGNLNLGSTLKGFAGGTGGSLSILAPLIQVGGTSSQNGALVFSPQFFNEGGFASFTLSGIGGLDASGNTIPAVRIVANTVIEPEAESYVAASTGGPNGGPLLYPVLEPEGFRSPVSLTFNALGLFDGNQDGNKLLFRGDFVMEAGAVIKTDPQTNSTGGVTINGNKSNQQTATVLGTIIAPGGTISINGSTSSGSAFIGANSALPTVYLGPQSYLSTAGATVLVPDHRGYVSGTVLPGGTINITGNIVADTGAVLNVSGTSGILDLSPAASGASTSLLGALSGSVVQTDFNGTSFAYRGLIVPASLLGTSIGTATTGLNGSFSGTPVMPTRVDSNGGSINLTGGELLLTNATLLGSAGGPAAQGGSLTLSSGRFTSLGATVTPLDPTLIVVQSPQANPQPVHRSGQSVIGNPVVDASGNPIAGTGYFAANVFQNGGFDSLTLAGSVQFSGPVSIQARNTLTVGTAGVILADSAVNLTAPHVVLGQPFVSPLQTSVASENTPPLQTSGSGATTFNATPGYGPGSLTITASLIDVGNLLLQNIGHTSLIADNGDIRGDGTFDSAGSLYMRAGQIYPASATVFNINVYDRNVLVASSTTGSQTVTLASSALPPGFGIGTPLLGSTVQSISGTTVTLAAGANATVSSAEVVFDPGSGSVTIAGSGPRPLPLSAAGSLNIYASNIAQGGVLRAPLGTITLGWDGKGTNPMDLISGTSVPVAQHITLLPGSLTSVSAIDPLTGQGVLIPDGFIVNGTQWVDATGVNIVSGGVPGKGITISGTNVSTLAGSALDVRGGGDLFAYQWIPGNGGSTDILGSGAAPTTWGAGTAYSAGALVTYKGVTYTARVASTGVTPSTSQFWSQVPVSYAVIPGYQFAYAPYGAFNTSGGSENLASNVAAGYVSSNLTAGEQVYLSASNGLPAGIYTLLPARYALLPGAVLVTPQSGTALGTIGMTDGSSVVAGYTLNGFDSSAKSLVTSFNVASAAVIGNRAQYTDYFGSQYLATEITLNGGQVPRLPMDSGTVSISGDQSLVLQGNVYGRSVDGGRGASIDISTDENILIGGANGSAPLGTAYLSATLLNSYGADSLLIGGLRTITSTGTQILVNTSNIEVNNAGAPLIGPEIMLAATQSITLDPNAEIIQSGDLSPQSRYYTPGIDIGGNGAFLRVSSLDVPLVRTSAMPSATSSTPSLVVSAGATISGFSVTLDSTASATIDPGAKISGQLITLDAGRISVVLPGGGTPPAGPGLVLQGSVLEGLESASRLSLTGYLSIDLYGSGQLTPNSLALHTPDLRSMDGGNIAIDTTQFSLDNAPGLTGSGPITPAQPLAGTLTVNAQTITIGQGQANIDQYATVAFNAPNGVLFQGTGGLNIAGSLTITAPLLTASKLANQGITTGGTLDIEPVAGGATSNLSSGLAATLTLTGSSVTENSNILLPSGTISLHATGASGNVTVGGGLDVAGITEQFYDLFAYTDAGQINLTSDQGNVTVNTGARLDVTAAGAGNAGTLSVSAPNGNFSVADNTMFGQGGSSGGTNGNFNLDVKTVPNDTVAPVDLALDAGDFSQSRNYRIRNVVNAGTSTITVGNATSLNYTLSSDVGSILVTGTINASGPQGGSISLISAGSVTLASGSVLTVAGQNFSADGKGGSVDLEAGSETKGNLTLGALGTGPQVNVQSGSTVILSVASNVAASSVTAVANTPVNLPASDQGIDVITTTTAGTITFADGTTASIAANTPTSVAGAVSVTLAGNGTVSFAGSAAKGDLTGTLHIRAPQTSSGTDLQVKPIMGTIVDASQIVLEGYKEYNLTSTGGAITTTVEGQIMTNGNTFVGSNGTNSATYSTMLNRVLPGGSANPLAAVTIIEPGAELVNTNGNLTLSTTWDLSTYKFGAKSVAGDLTLRASGNLVFNFKASLSDGFAGPPSGTTGVWLENLLPAGSSSWSYRLVSGADFSATDYHKVQPLSTLASTSGSLLLGQGATALSTNSATQRQAILQTFYQTIRTGTGSIDIVAGRDVQLLNPLATIYTAGTQAPTMADFDLPNPTYTIGLAGAQTPFYPVFYTVDGGRVTITAQNNITHLGVGGVADSSKEMPTDWLYRRDFVDPNTGQFGSVLNGRTDIASTTWWVDFSNFLEGVGALGGGNVTLTAGNNITNVDAVIPTNARMPKGTPNTANLLELGGGDLVIHAGADIDGGVYYVERGDGTLQAGGTIHTNATRSTNLSAPTTADQLPTTLFLGVGNFNVSARGNVLLGPVSNPFLLPSGIDNNFAYRSYFSTYAPTDVVEVSSLTGDVTVKDDAFGGVGSLATWYQAQYFSTGKAAVVSQPWLKTYETVFSTSGDIAAAALMPPTLNVTTFTGNINLLGTITLAPAPTGTLNLLSAGAINGFQPNSITAGVAMWDASTITVSDANPANVPSITAPIAAANVTSGTNTNALGAFTAMFTETGASTGTVQSKQALHDSNLLHSGDTTPVHIYAAGGDISGMSLFTPKLTDVLASNDITDVGFYIQNLSAQDISVVSAGRDIILYDPNSTLRQEAQAPGNGIVAFTPGTLTGFSTRPGDIQINGPGTVEVLAGRNLDLGDGPNFVDGTGVGITSNGNARNPFLPFGGANIIAMAGIGGPSDLSANSSLDFTTFISKDLTAGSPYLAELGIKATDLSSMSEEDKARIALQVFYLILRDAGRAQTAGTGSYATGTSAITSLFGTSHALGDINTRSRTIVTESGGDISLAAPGGSLTLQTSTATTTLTPPGIITQDGGNVSIFTDGDVNLGVSRIFTLRGGNIIIWSTNGNIAAGSSPKTVVSAPPTRVLIDPISADVKTDLAGLATGGGIGVLATVADVPPGNVDLVAPKGTVDAGDAGIRATGNLNIAATKVLNADNITVSGTTTGAPAPVVPSAPNIGIASQANNAQSATSSQADQVKQQQQQQTSIEPDSEITVEVVGFGGGEGNSSGSETSQ